MGRQGGQELAMGKTLWGVRWRELMAIWNSGPEPQGGWLKGRHRALPECPLGKGT